MTRVGVTPAVLAPLSEGTTHRSPPCDHATGMSVHPSRPTIADVARRAGVSRTAVSFAINGRPGVGEETRARILRAAEELGWEPSVQARALTRARSGAIGLVLERDSENLELDEFFMRFLVGAQRTLVARECGLLLQMVVPGPDGGLMTYRRLIAGGSIDGMLLTDPRFDDPRIPLLAASGLPVVLAGRPAGACPFPFVETAHAEGMAMLVDHLMELGHRSIAFVGGDPSLEYVAARRDAWMATMRRARVEPGLSASVVPEDPVGRAATARLLQAARPPTALVYTGDLLALAGLGVARSLGLDVPADVSIAGFDDSSVAAVSAPPLTTVRVDYTEFGKAATAALMSVIDGEDPPRFEPTAPRLIVRASTGAPPRSRRRRLSAGRSRV